jgi:hypothetical protein
LVERNNDPINKMRDAMARDLVERRRDTTHGFRAYMGYDGSLGSEEGASLIFARTAKEAKKVFWAGAHGDLVQEYVDVRVRVIKDGLWLFREANQEKLVAGEPHLVFAPKSCCNCGLWGHAAIGSLGYCLECLRARRADERDGLRTGRP